MTETKYASPGNLMALLSTASVEVSSRGHQLAELRDHFSPGIDVTTTSAVVATLQGSAGGKTTVHRVSVSTTGDTFTIYLTANATSSVKAAWIILG